MKLPERALEALARYNEAHFGFVEAIRQPEHAYHGADRRKLTEPLTKHG